MQLLHIDSSILGDHSASRTLSQAVTHTLTSNTDTVVYRDVGSDSIAPLTPELIAIGNQPVDTHSAFQRQQSQLTDTLIAELQASDVLVIGAPMYNFSIPIGLRAWFDRVLAAGRTFRYTAQGPEGLLKGKKAILVLTSGGKHSQTPVNQLHEGYLRTVLGFIGITDISVVRAEGLNMSSESRQAAMAAAAEQISQLAETVSA